MAAQQATPATPEEEGATSSSRQIRGSALLLFGRFITLGVGFVAQVVTVRYLAKSDYGAFAYALSVVSLGASVAAFGLDKAASRFLPIYQERGDRARILGTVVLAVATMAVIGFALVVLAFIGRSALGAVADPTAVAVLLVLAVLTPIQALDPLVTAILAALARPRVIFVRRYVLEPLFELAVLAIVILAGAGVLALAAGYVVAGIVGLVIYGAIVVSVLRDAGYLSRGALSRMVVPWREVLSFSVPLLSSDLVFVLRGALVVILLELFGSALDVADFRAVFPQARLNLVVLQSFTFLYLPLAARLHAKDDLPGMRALHDRSTAWVALMSYPLFAASFAIAGPVVGLLYGERYEASAPVLAVLSIGFFASAIFGFAGLTLRALGAVRTIVGIDLATALASFAIYLAVIPPYGAMGAAVGTTVTLVAQGVAYHLAARRAGAVGTQGASAVRLLGGIALASAALVGVQLALAPPLWLGVALVVLSWAVLLVLARGALDIAGSFPEIRRVPVLGALAGGGRLRAASDPAVGGESR